jgi:hypothetical protein
VRGEIPDDADVRLVKAQVHTARGHEEHFAELARVDQLLDLHHRRAVQERVPGHQHQAVLGSEREELSGVLHGGCERLLDEDVLARVQRSRGQLEVRGDGSRDRDRVHVIGGQHVRVLGRGPHARVTAQHLVERLRPRVDHPHGLRTIERVEIADDVRPPVAHADHRETDVSGAHCVSRLRSMSSGVRASSRRSRPSDQERA